MSARLDEPFRCYRTDGMCSFCLRLIVNFPSQIIKTPTYCKVLCAEAKALQF